MEYTLKSSRLTFEAVVTTDMLYGMIVSTVVAVGLPPAHLVCEGTHKTSPHGDRNVRGKRQVIQVQTRLDPCGRIIGPWQFFCQQKGTRWVPLKPVIRGVADSVRSRVRQYHAALPTAHGLIDKHVAYHKWLRDIDRRADHEHGDTLVATLGHRALAYA